MADTTLPSTMRAWQYSSTKGGLEKNLKINPSAPLPKPKPDQHLIRITIVSLNPVDYKPAEVTGVARFAAGFPATPGIDFAGIIAVPAAKSSLKVGQRVFGSAGSSPVAGGALAEYALAGTKATAVLPTHPGVEDVDGCTVGVAGLTAYQSIVPNVKEGDRIFINGGSGGTGVFGLQFAKAVGCHVTTTCSTPNIDFCKGLGADKVIDYRKENVLQVLKAEGKVFDHVVDNIGNDQQLIWHCHEFNKQDAKYVVVGGSPSLATLGDILKRKFLPDWAGGVKGNVVGFFPEQKTEDLSRIAEWMREGKVKAVVDQKFGFEEAVQAFEKLKTGRARGKIVVDVAN